MPASPATRTLGSCLSLGLSAVLLSGCSGDDSTGPPSGTPTPSDTSSVPVLQPGKPGETNSTLTGTQKSRKAEKVHPADVTFMQDMIVHHAQAVTMVDIVKGKLTDPQVQKMAIRIGIEQKPEMAYMRKWLRTHGQKVPSTDESHHGHGGHDGHEGHSGHGGHEGHEGHEGMPGMATPAQLEDLRKAKGPAKDILFLDLMIKHHGGALTMVDDLVEDGGNKDAEVEKFSGDVYAVQSGQIRTMDTMRKRLKADNSESAPAPPTT